MITEYNALVEARNIVYRKEKKERTRMKKKIEKGVERFLLDCIGDYYYKKLKENRNKIPPSRGPDCINEKELRDFYLKKFKGKKKSVIRKHICSCEYCWNIYLPLVERIKEEKNIKK